MLFVETEVVNQLFLDLEGLAAFFTLVPATGMDKDKETLQISLCVILEINLQTLTSFINE